MPNPFSHIDQRVPDLEAGVTFYGAILPAIGFSKYNGGQAFRTWSTPDGTGPTGPWFGITEDPGHVPNANRIAFWAASRERVDQLAQIVREAGAKNVSGPKAMPQYSKTYYGLFFDDPWGNPLEVVHW